MNLPRSKCEYFFRSMRNFFFHHNSYWISPVTPLLPYTSLQKRRNFFSMFSVNVSIKLLSLIFTAAHGVPGRINDRELVMSIWANNVTLSLFPFPGPFIKCLPIEWRVVLQCGDAMSWRKRKAECISQCSSTESVGSLTIRISWNMVRPRTVGRGLGSTGLTTFTKYASKVRRYKVLVSYQSKYVIWNKEDMIHNRRNRGKVSRRQQSTKGEWGKLTAN